MSQSVSGTKYHCASQWVSSLLLKALTEGECTTASGSRFQSLMTRIGNAFRRTRLEACGLGQLQGVASCRSLVVQGETSPAQRTHKHSTTHTTHNYTTTQPRRRRSGPERESSTQSCFLEGTIGKGCFSCTQLVTHIHTYPPFSTSSKITTS